MPDPAYQAPKLPSCPRCGRDALGNLTWNPKPEREPGDMQPLQTGQATCQSCMARVELVKPPEWRDLFN
jgi:hypothetical protein